MPDKHEDLASLTTCARELELCADDYASEVGELEKTVTSQNPWGADGPSTIFGTVYTDVVNHALEVYSSRAEDLRSTAAGVAAWSGNSRAGEQAGTEWLGSLRDGLTAT